VLAIYYPNLIAKPICAELFAELVIGVESDKEEYNRG
jgi:hypothetical protein